MSESISEMQKPFIWAHRGASQHAPENTLAAFALAAAVGADGLELDVHLSYDGFPVVLHDERLDRTTDGSGEVSRWRLCDLQELDAGGWFGEDYQGETLPTLLEVLAMFSGHLKLNLEVKQAGAGLAVLDLLKEFPAADVVVSSFDRKLLKLLRRVDHDLPLAVLLDSGDWHRALRLAVEIDAVAFHPRADLISRPLLAACRRAGLPVHVWTVDRPDDVRRLIRAGVAGIFTNDPEAVAGIGLPGLRSRVEIPHLLG